ncbi:MAG: hypothetical protein QG629_436 [Patescibacteria group bacterium]|nr:DUF4190 domain-containing protein [Candidatus Saccharibacteria bacterium]MDQ5963354.1 hypothetical protein [Patescibacteria group bacterium]
MSPENQQPQPQQNFGNDDSFQRLLPTKNKDSLLSYYFGIFGLIPIPVIGNVLAVLAIVFGHKAMKTFRTNPTPGAKGHAMTGLILGYIELVIGITFWVVLIYSSVKYL